MTPRRARLFAQLAIVCDRDAAAAMHEYAWPPVQPTPEEVAQAEHLAQLGSTLWRRAKRHGFSGGGSDAAFGGPS